MLIWLPPLPATPAAFIVPGKHLLQSHETGPTDESVPALSADTLAEEFCDIGVAATLISALLRMEHHLLFLYISQLKILWAIWNNKFKARINESVTRAFQAFPKRCT